VRQRENLFLQCQTPHNDILYNHEFMVKGERKILGIAFRGFTIFSTMEVYCQGSKVLALPLEALHKVGQRF